jgi:hypothetical protein
VEEPAENLQILLDDIPDKRDIRAGKTPISEFFEKTNGGAGSGVSLRHFVQEPVQTWVIQVEGRVTRGSGDFGHIYLLRQV